MSLSMVTTALVTVVIAAIISASIFPCSSRADEPQPCSTTSSPINQETTTEKYPWHNNNVYPPNNRPHSQVPASINLIDSNSTSPSATCSSKKWCAHLYQKFCSNKLNCRSIGQKIKCLSQNFVASFCSKLSLV